MRNLKTFFIQEEAEAGTVDTFNETNVFLKQLMRDLDQDPKGVFDFILTYFPNDAEKDKSVVFNIRKIHDRLLKKQSEGEELSNIEKIFLSSADYALKQVEKTKNEEVTRIIKDNIFLILGTLGVLYLLLRK